jgi:hypothetical protein
LMVFLLMWLPGTRQVANQLPVRRPGIEHSLHRFVIGEA